MRRSPLAPSRPHRASRPGVDWTWSEVVVGLPAAHRGFCDGDAPRSEAFALEEGHVYHSEGILDGFADCVAGNLALKLCSLQMGVDPLHD